MNKSVAHFEYSVQKIGGAVSLVLSEEAAEKLQVLLCYIEHHRLGTDYEQSQAHQMQYDLWYCLDRNGPTDRFVKADDTNDPV